MAVGNICSIISETVALRRLAPRVGISSRRWALASAAADLRGTGHPDLFVANDYGVAELYQNDGTRFHEAGVRELAWVLLPRAA